MPIGLDPKESAPFILPADRDRDDPPTFLFHFLTVSELRKVQKLREEARAEQDNDRSLELVEQAIAAGLEGWRNVRNRKGEPVPYPAPLADVLTLVEMWEMANGYPAAVMESEAALKKASPSRSPSNSGNSAKRVEAPAAV